MGNHPFRPTTGTGTMTHPLYGIIGVGQIGGTLAHLLIGTGMGPIVLYDTSPALAKGKALDLAQAATIGGHQASLLRVASSYEELAACRVIIITAGLARRPGMSRQELMDENLKIIRHIAHNLRPYDATLIVVTNPVDIMTYWMQQETGFAPQRVIGMAGVLDSGRFKTFLSEALQVPASEIEAWVIGPHNDHMIPVLSNVKIAGFPLQTWMQQKGVSEEVLAAVVKRTQQAGAEIVALLEKGSAYYGPAQAIFEMLRSMQASDKKPLACSVALQGPKKQVYCGFPVHLGWKGVEAYCPLSLTAQEQAQFDRELAALDQQIAIGA